MTDEEIMGMPQGGKKLMSIQQNQQFRSHTMKRKKKKFILCLLATIASLFITSIFLSRMDEMERSYDYSQVQEIGGMVVDIQEHYHVSSGSSYTEVIELENDTTVDIGTGSTPRDNIGDRVTVYTDGRYYEFSEYGIADDNSGGFWYIILPSLLLFACLILWGIWFGWKGFLTGACLLLVAYGMMAV
jgi:hypothetical protein